MPAPCILNTAARLARTSATQRAPAFIPVRRLHESNPEPTHYDTLSLPPTASAIEIKKFVSHSSFRLLPVLHSFRRRSSFTPHPPSPRSFIRASLTRPQTFLRALQNAPPRPQPPRSSRLSEILAHNRRLLDPVQPRDAASLRPRPPPAPPLLAPLPPRARRFAPRLRPLPPPHNRQGSPPFLVPQRALRRRSKQQLVRRRRGEHRWWAEGEDVRAGRRTGGGRAGGAREPWSRRYELGADGRGGAGGEGIPLWEEKGVP